jgi:hypothetical protein
MSRNLVIWQAALSFVFYSYYGALSIVPCLLYLWSKKLYGYMFVIYCDQDCDLCCIRQTLHSDNQASPHQSRISHIHGIGIMLGQIDQRSNSIFCFDKPPVFEEKTLRIMDRSPDLTIRNSNIYYFLQSKSSARALATCGSPCSPVLFMAQV